MELSIKISPVPYIIPYGKAIMKFALIVFVFLAFQNNSVGQSTADRPKVGLTLSGGGACGIAHVGVLKVMEEAGLRPDYITGVSMGSIIGGMYSIGYSADTIAYLLRIADWDNILTGRIPESKVIFPEKRHFMNSIISLPLTLKKVKLPSGLINGQQIENTMSYFAWPAADINDFSKLPIPFLCLATDIINNRKVILNKGYLPDAIRASIAVPSVFTPIRIDSMLLIDGGFIRNFAATELKDMGADILIGSYTGYKQHTADQVETVSDVVKQLGMIRSVQDYQEQKKLVDFIIEPDISNCSISGFENSDTLISRGYRAAAKFRERFRKLADSLNRIAPPKAPENIFNRQTYSFDRVEINGNKVYSDDQILGVLDIKPGDAVDRNNITDKIELLYGKAWFEKVKYRFVKSDDSLILALDCEEKPRALLYGSVHYDNALRAGLILGLSVKNPLFGRSQLDINSFIGDSYRFSFEYIQFLDRNEKYSLSPFVYAAQTYIPAMDFFNETGATYSRDFFSGLMLKKRLGLNHMVSLSGQYENLTLDRNYISDSGREKLRSNNAAALFDYNINSLDNKHFPNKGIVSSFLFKSSKLFSAKLITDTATFIYDKNATVPLDSKMYYTFHWRINMFFTRYKKWTLGTGGEILYVTATDSVSSQNNCFFAGGIESVTARSVPLTGFNPLQLQVRKMASINLNLDYEVLKNLHLTLMGSVAALNDLSDSKDFTLLGGIGAGAGYLSVIGPIKAGLMYSIYRNEEHYSPLKGYISIGYNF
jgi:NTE family protein